MEPLLVLRMCTGVMTLSLVGAALFPAAYLARPASAAPLVAPAPRPPDPPHPDPPPPKPALPAHDGGPSRLVASGSRDCPLIGLTFDAGWSAEGAAAILSALRQFGAPSTFYLTGHWTQSHPELAKQIAADGHEIANHTDRHPDLTRLPPEAVAAEITAGAERIAKGTGSPLSPQFRPPYGAYDDRVLAIAGRLGYGYTVYWSIDTLDWQQPPAEAIAARVLTRAAGGDIVLMHLGAHHTGEALHTIIPALRAMGLKPATVTEVLTCPTSDG